MTNYRDYDTYALCRDASFRAWVLTASPEDDAFWTDWLRQNPDRAATIEQAKAIVVAVQRQYQSPISDEEVRAGVSRLLAQVQTEIAHDTPVIPLNSRPNWVRWVAAAASVILIIAVGWQLIQRQAVSLTANEPLAATQSSPWIDRVNSGRAPLAILLEDGSVVTLEPDSRLRYRRRFDGPRREVTLTGEAFFEVARRSQQPFVVTTAEFTTTVLGTSFRVRSSSPQHQALVVVRSGKVAVQARVPARSAASETAAKSPIILERNQQVVLENDSPRPLQRSVVQKVELLQNDVNREQVFSDVAVSAVFDALEKQYGVTIQYDQAVLSRCLVTTSFAEENLRERLSAVCQAVGATYQIADDHILISSSGCTL